jgi:hypothetical protein
MDKRCTRCGAVKSLDDFYRHDGCRDGVRPECKACNLAEKAKRHRENPEPARARTRQWQQDNPERYRDKAAAYAADGRKKLSDRRSYLKRKYGITLEEYDEMLVRQDGRCAICRCEPRPDISLHVDHDHGSGAIRSLLCFRCNVAIGLIAEDPDHLRAIEEYFFEHDPEAHADRELIERRLALLKRPA